MPDARGLMTDVEQRDRDAWLAERRAQATRARDAATRILGLIDDVEQRQADPAVLYGPWEDGSEAWTEMIDCWKGPDHGPDEQDRAGAEADAAYERLVDK